jgi:hypothetical protein
MEMGCYELAKKVIEQLPESGKKYVCLNGYKYAFENEYLPKYELCTDNFYVVWPIQKYMTRRSTSLTCY